MYRDELAREAELIALGQQALVRDAAEFLTRLKSKLGRKAPR